MTSNVTNIKQPAYTNPYKLNMRLLKQILEKHRPSFAPVQWFHALLDPRIPQGAGKVVDDYGNIFVQVGDSEQTDVAFTCHLDTVARFNSKPPKVKMTANGVLYVGNPEVADCLGADCGAGIYLMLEMLEAGVHGRYCFFLDEEVGCHGSGFSVKDKTGFWTGIKAMISFDRRLDGVITTQRFQRCCSDKFALELAHRLGRNKSNLQSGIYTDSAEFMHVVPECTNIGVGYNFEHTPDETLDLNILGQLLNRCLDPWTFKDLPISRDPSEVHDPWSALGAASAQQYPFDLPEKEDPDLLLAFREVSQLSKEQLIRWVKENPKEAAEYIMIFSDYGFKQELIEVGTKVIDDWGGYQNIVEG